MLANEADMTMKKEKLSALVDGELSKGETIVAAQVFKHPEALADAELYYLIGEELRAGSAQASLSPEFSKGLAARLEAEPPLKLETSIQSEKAQGSRSSSESVQPGKTVKTVDSGDKKHGAKPLAVSGMAVV